MRIGAYIYTRVSTAIQTEGYSLEAQRQKILDYAKYRGMHIWGEYSDAGFSGKNISGRLRFQQMLEDIQNKKDDVQYVLVFKLSRFGRNAADVLNSLQFMQDYGVNLFCVEDNIDSAADSGKLMISVMSAMAEIERENILVQTMAGRRQKAAGGGWNGGLAPYGYELKEGSFQIIEEEARAVRDAFELYVSTNKGAAYVAGELNKRYSKKVRQPKDVNRFTPEFVKRILDNPVYCGKIAYGRTVSEKIEGRRNEYHRITQKDGSKIILAQGNHEPIVSEEVWKRARQRREDSAYRPENTDKEHCYILSGLLRCPNCGARMYGRMNGRKYKKDGTPYDPSYSYVCRTRFAENGVECSRPASYAEKPLVKMVRDVMAVLIRNDGFQDLVECGLRRQLKPDKLTKELEAVTRECRRLLRLQQQIENQLNSIDYDQKNAEKLEASLNNRLCRVLEDIAENEIRADDLRERMENARKLEHAEQGICDVLTHFDEFFEMMEDGDKRDFLISFIESIELIAKSGRVKGQWIKRIHFCFPMSLKDGRTYKAVDLDCGASFPTLADDCLHVNIGIE